ncbi:MAG: NAD-dependent protein deacylase [Oscillospiraceae bacterium]|jgi:NAD-dependent deacetylase|nr:NAD-dependent protein deacylase [Oscillospiraceae bacterium]
MSSTAERLAELIKTSRSAVFFGGAGVSTESGIPDFRSEDGLFRAQSAYGRSPEELVSSAVFLREPELFFRYYKENLVAQGAKPNPAHLALAKMEAAGMLGAVITQNVDGLHQAAGSENVFELHGSNHRPYCVSCGQRYSLDYILNPENCRGALPVCRECGGTVRPDVVLYGEGLDDGTVRGAVAAISAAELLIVGGTSLSVYPAAGFLSYFSGPHLALINKTRGPLDDRAELALHEPIGEVLGQIARILGL